MGMETGPLILFCSLFWIVLSNEKNTRSKWCQIILLAQIILLFRLDSVFFLGSFGLIHLLLSNSENRKPLIFTGVVVSVLTLGWLYFCKYNYGHYFPHSMLAKSSFSNELKFRLFELTGTWIGKVVELLRLNFPWPLKLKSFLGLIYGSSVFGGFLISVIYWHKLRKDQKIALLGTALYIFSYALFFTLGRAGIFPWYAHLPCFIFFGVTIPIIMENIKKPEAAIVSMGLLAGAALMQTLGVIGLRSLKDQNSSGLFLSKHLKTVECQTVIKDTKILQWPPAVSTQSERRSLQLLGLQAQLDEKGIFCLSRFDLFKYSKASTGREGILSMNESDCTK